MWLLSEQIDEMLFQKSGSSPMCYSALVFVLKSGLF